MWRAFSHKRWRFCWVDSHSHIHEYPSSYLYPKYSCKDLYKYNNKKNEEETASHVLFLWFICILHVSYTHTHSNFSLHTHLKEFCAREEIYGQNYLYRINEMKNVFLSVKWFVYYFSDNVVVARTIQIIFTINLKEKFLKQHTMRRKQQSKPVCACLYENLH